MPATHVTDVDLAKVSDEGGEFIRYLAWGDFVEVVGDPAANPVRVKATKMVAQPDGSDKIPTDGTRLLVYTDSGNVKLKEAYAYQMTADGPRAANVIRV